MSKYNGNREFKINIPGSVKLIVDVLENNGYEAFAVGGCVRDTILDREPQDWDITTSALPEQVKELFNRTLDTGIHGEYNDSRHPESVEFTSNLIEDLKRRDFTINAMAYNEREGLVDAFDGINDINNKIIRCVGEPEERFGEDALRILRAVRFSAQLGFDIDEKTMEAIKKLAPTLERIHVSLLQHITQVLQK